MDTQIRPESLVERASHPLSTLPRPFLRWAGSKQRLLRQIVPRLPATFGTYYEPFLGAGSLFFLLQPSRAVLSDANSELIETFRAVRDEPREILRYLVDLDPLDRDAYYEIRDSTYTDRFRAAARFIYLNRACWNGLYRVNSKGKFNVPYGAPSTSNIVEASVLRACSSALRGSDVKLLHVDFEAAVATSVAGDLVFLDPPYVTGHNNNGFIDYNEKLFSWADQRRLACMAAGLQRAGRHILVTNAYHPDLLKMYPRFNFDVLSRHSTLAANGNFRKPIEEVLLWQRSAQGE